MGRAHRLLVEDEVVERKRESDGRSGESRTSSPLAPGNVESVERGGQFGKESSADASRDHRNAIRGRPEGEQVRASLRRLARLRYGRCARPQDDALVSLRRASPEQAPQERRERRRLLRFQHLDFRSRPGIAERLERPQYRLERLAQVRPVTRGPGKPHPHPAGTHPRGERRDETNPDRRPVLDPLEEDGSGTGDPNCFGASAEEQAERKQRCVARRS